MGQKVNPHGLRVGVIKDWDSRWYASDEKVGDLIVEDQKIRKYLKKTLYGAGVPVSRPTRTGGFAIRSRNRGSQFYGRFPQNWLSAHCHLRDSLHC